MDRPGWSCSAHGTRGTCEWGQRKLDTGLQGPGMTKLRQAASRPSGCQRMTSSGCRHLRVSSFLSFKIKNGSLENAHRALASYLTSLKIIIQPSVGKQWSIGALEHWIGILRSQFQLPSVERTTVLVAPGLSSWRQLAWAGSYLVKTIIRWWELISGDQWTSHETRNTEPSQSHPDTITRPQWPHLLNSPTAEIIRWMMVCKTW